MRGYNTCLNSVSLPHLYGTLLRSAIFARRGGREERGRRALEWLTTRKREVLALRRLTRKHILSFPSILLPATHPVLYGDFLYAIYISRNFRSTQSPLVFSPCAKSRAPMIRRHVTSPRVSDKHLGSVRTLRPSYQDVISYSWCAKYPRHKISQVHISPLHLKAFNYLVNKFYLARRRLFILFLCEIIGIGNYYLFRNFISIILNSNIKF